MVWPDYWGSQIHGIQTHVKGLTNVHICIKFEEDATYGYFDIEANVKMLTVRPTDSDIDFVKTYHLVALKCIFTKYYSGCIVTMISFVTISE